MSKEQLRYLYKMADHAEVYSKLLNIAAGLADDGFMTKEEAVSEILAIAEKIGESLGAKIA